MDPAVTGSVVTAAVGLVALIISKCRCVVRVKEDIETEELEWDAQVGFTETPLTEFQSRRFSVQNVPENSIVYRTRG